MDSTNLHNHLYFDPEYKAKVQDINKSTTIRTCETQSWTRLKVFVTGTGCCQTDSTAACDCGWGRCCCAWTLNCLIHCLIGLSSWSCGWGCGWGCDWLGAIGACGIGGKFLMPLICCISCWIGSIGLLCIGWVFTGCEFCAATCCTSGCVFAVLIYKELILITNDPIFNRYLSIAFETQW